MKQEVAAPQAAETAKEVGENVKELQKTLEQAKEGATQEVKQDLQKAEVAVSDTATKALEVLVEKQPQAPEIVSKEEVATLVQDKIITTQAKLEAAVVVSDATDKADKDAGNPAQPSPINDTCKEAAAKAVPQAAGSTSPGSHPAEQQGETLPGQPVPAPVSCAQEKLDDAQKSLEGNDLSKALESTKEADKIVQAVVDKQGSSVPVPEPSVIPTPVVIPANAGIQTLPVPAPVPVPQAP